MTGDWEKLVEAYRSDDLYPIYERLKEAHLKPLSKEELFVIWQMLHEGKQKGGRANKFENPLTPAHRVRELEREGWKRTAAIAQTAAELRISVRLVQTSLARLKALQDEATEITGIDFSD